MKRSLRSLTLVGLLVAGCQLNPPLEKPLPEPAVSMSMDQVVAGNNAFAFDLCAKIRSDSGNLFFSPASISTALAMAYAGTEGKTAEEMATVMHFTLDRQQMHPAFASLLNQMNGGEVARFKRDYQLTVANALWGQKGYPWKQDFLKTAGAYGAGLHEVDFKHGGQASIINSWVENNTRGKIKNLVSDNNLDDNTRLVLTNAIYFKGEWADQFQKESTRDQKFFLTIKRDVMTPMLGRMGDYRIFENGDMQMLELPYKGKELSMCVLLPRKVDGIDALEKALSARKLDECLKRSGQAEVVVTLPKFKMEHELALSTVLEDMGMKTAFNKKLANFQGMANARALEENLYISAVLHKAFVEVNEEGSEAAAATAVVMEGFAITAPTSKPEPKIFCADHPFVFLIRDNRSGSILFMGRVMDPSAK